MTPSHWKFTTSDNNVVIRIASDGSLESCSIVAISDWLAAGNTPEPADLIAPVIPVVISMAQARLALLNAGLLDAVEHGISSMPRATQIDWEFRHTVERNSPLVATFAAALNLDDVALDALFLAGAKL